MALDIIGAGFGRTGTLSLKLALEHLGFGPCDHMQVCLDHPERFALWAQALEQRDRGGAIDWAPLFTDYRATVDWPGAYFWRELANAHPHARVILTVRDPEQWYDSVAKTIHRVPRLLGGAPFSQGLLALAGLISPKIHDWALVTDEIIWRRTFEGRFGDRAHAIAALTAHNAAVERTIAPDRLLVFNVGDGWEPLCAFLGVPVPETPFPRAKSQQEFERQILQRAAPIAAALAGSALLAGGAALALGRASTAAARKQRASGVKPRG